MRWSRPALVQHFARAFTGLLVRAAESQASVLRYYVRARGQRSLALFVTSSGSAGITSTRPTLTVKARHAMPWHLPLGWALAP